MDGTSFLESPMRTPQITDLTKSPVRSVHPPVMESLQSHGDFVHAQGESFFHDDSSDGDSIDRAETHRVDESVGIAVDGSLRSPSRKRRSGNYLGGTTEQFRSHCDPQPYATQSNDLESQYASSAEDVHASSHNSRKSHISHLHITKKRLHHQRSRSSTTNDQTNETSGLGKPSTKADHILGAHRLTIKALQRLTDDNQDVPISPMTVDGRESKLLNMESRPRHRSLSAPAKKVSMAPPPINTSHYPLPDNLITTPYPFAQFRRKDFGSSPNTVTSVPPSAHPNDSLMTLSIQRSNPSSRIRITTLTIPANSDFSTAVRSGNNSAKEKHFAGLDFDDMELFRQLNVQYRHLLGSYRFFAARSISHIIVTGIATKAADAGYGWLLGPRSPRLLASRGLSDTFSEEKMMRHFLNPKLGKARYAWVSWAHRLAAAPSSPAPLLPAVDTPASAESMNSRAWTRNSMIRRAENHEGLEFVVSWSAKRISLVLLTVIWLSVAATLLWIFLGPDSQAGPFGVTAGGGGYRHAGGRVGTGLVMGICVLLIGLTSMAGWIGVSWLVL